MYIILGNDRILWKVHRKGDIVKQKICKVVGGIFILGYIILIMCMDDQMGQVVLLDIKSVFIIGIVVVTPLVLGTVLMVLGATNESTKRNVVNLMKWLLFVPYCVVIKKVCLDRFYGYDTANLWGYIKTNINIVPFKTIIEYILAYIEQTINTSTIVQNLAGNLILFMPMAVLLPCLFKMLRKWSGFLGCMLIILFAVEVIQIVTMAGSFDIDDFILNMAGACIVFAVIKTKVVIEALHKVYVI